MIDVGLKYDEKIGWDIDIQDGKIAKDYGFKICITASLFSDRRADESEIARPDLRRGWMGDVASDSNGHKYGSLLWLLEQRRLTQSTLNDAVSYARQSLQWFVDKKIASRIKVDGEFVANYGIRLIISIEGKDGKVSKYYANLWDRTLKDA